MDSSLAGTVALVAGGSQPDAWRYLVEVLDPGRPADTTGYR